MTNPRDDLMAPDFYAISESELCEYCGADARRWAEAFCQIKARQGWSAEDIDAGLMICWFASAIETASVLRLAASRPAAQVADREAVARALCESGKFETGEGTCALLCMDQLGGVRKKGCNHLTRVHGKLDDAILSLLRPAEPVETEHPALEWSLSDDAKRRLSEIDENIRHAVIASPGMKAGGIQPGPDAVGEPVAWRARRLEWVERIGVDGTFDASTSIGHYIATITDDGRGMWFIVGLTTSNYIDGDISAVQFAAQSDYENRIRSAIEVAPHPHAQPDISAAVLAERERCARICEGDFDSEMKSYGKYFAAAIRQLPTSERGDE